VKPREVLLSCDSNLSLLMAHGCAFEVTTKFRSVFRWDTRTKLRCTFSRNRIAYVVGMVGDSVVVVVVIVVVVIVVVVVVVVVVLVCCCWL